MLLVASKKAIYKCLNSRDNIFTQIVRYSVNFTPNLWNQMLNYILTTIWFEIYKVQKLNCSTLYICNVIINSNYELFFIIILTTSFFFQIIYFVVVYYLNNN